MKTKYFFIALCFAAMMVACSGNEPDNGNNANKELMEQLGLLVDGLGNITSSTTQSDGSVVMTDDKGNTITTDADGNAVIVSAEGDSTFVDHSIQEDPNTPHDKWYNSKWASISKNSPEIDPNGPKRWFIETLNSYSFEVTMESISLDTTRVTVGTDVTYEVFFHNTTASLKQTNTVKRYTDNMTEEYNRYFITPQTIGDGEMRYRLTIEDSYVVLYEDRYYYNYDEETYILIESVHVASCAIEADGAIYIWNGSRTNSENIAILSQLNKTTIFNYRRLTDTQIAASNNFTSYILKEEKDSERPEMDVYDLIGNYLISLQLVSL